ncbi:MAG: hypothetical protein P8180_05040 [Gammaproteobacteria bacterium]|jgi:hypothetical protein
MTATTQDDKLLLKYRERDTVTGITRATARRVAKALGLNETQTIHLAMAQLAKEVLPAYEPDNGPLKPKELEAIRKLVPQDRPFTATKGLL